MSAKWRALVVAGVVLVAALGGAGANADGAARTAFLTAAGIGIVALALGVNLARAGSGRSTRASDPNSVEHATATQARAAAYIDAVVLAAAAWLAVVAFSPVDARTVVACYLVAIVLAFYVRYLIGIRARGV